MQRDAVPTVKEFEWVSASFRTGWEKLAPQVDQCREIIIKLSKCIFQVLVA
jgi:hypothetical protein